MGYIYKSEKFTPAREIQETVCSVLGCGFHNTKEVKPCRDNLDPEGWLIDSFVPRGADYEVERLQKGVYKLTSKAGSCVAVMGENRKTWHVYINPERGE